MGEIEHHYKRLIIIVITAAIICNLSFCRVGKQIWDNNICSSYNNYYSHDS